MGRNSRILPWLGVAGALTLAAGALAARVTMERDPGALRVRLTGSVYSIPRGFQPSAEDDRDFFLQVALPDWGALPRDRPGWDDNVNILVSKQINTVAQLWDWLWDGTPRGAPRANSITRVYRIEPNFTVQEMGSGFDMVIPDQDRVTFPLGILRCSRPKPDLRGYAPSCEYMFDRPGQRWKVSFGRQFLADYRQIGDRAVALVEGFRETK